MKLSRKGLGFNSFVSAAISALLCFLQDHDLSYNMKLTEAVSLVWFTRKYSQGTQDHAIDESDSSGWGDCALKSGIVLTEPELS